LFFDGGVQVSEFISGGIKKAQLMAKLDGMLAPEVVQRIHSARKPTVSEYEVVILGGGPAGLTAGIYLGQAKVKTLLIDPALPGGYMGITHQVSNYPGFTEPQPGFMLAHFMGEQAKNSGIDLKLAVDVTSVDLLRKEVVVDELETIRFKKIILAMGTTPNTMNAPGEETFKGKGISYCATCDAKYFEGKEVVVIGGGNSAVEEALFISKFASKITMVHQFGKLTANQSAVDKLLADPKITVVYDSEPRLFEKVEGSMVTTIENVRTHEHTKLTADGVFVFIGFKANLSCLGDIKPSLDSWGYIATDENRKTDMPDVYAAGDVVSKKYRQITTAVADGTIAAIECSKNSMND
jgi:thioredoxin reductase (NADPH)